MKLHPSPNSRMELLAVRQVSAFHDKSTKTVKDILKIADQPPTATHTLSRKQLLEPPS